MKYTKMWKEGSWEFIQEDRVERFLSEGWTLEKPTEEKVTKSKSKNKISADAQVTSKASEEKENYSLESWGDDPDAIDTLTFSEDDFQTAKKED